MSAHGTMRAYADCNMGWEAGQHERSLKYLADSWMSVSEWVRVMGEAVPGGYNEFDVARVAAALRPYAGKVQCLAAREMSVALYVRGPVDVLVSLKRTMVRDCAVDEADGADVDGVRCLRLWWD